MRKKTDLQQIDFLGTTLRLPEFVQYLLQGRCSLDFTEFWERSNHCFSGYNLVVPLSSCQINENMLLVYFMSSSRGWKCSAHICRDLFILILHQDEVGKVPRTSCRKFQLEQELGDVGKGGKAEQDTTAWTAGFHPDSSSRVASTPCSLSSSAENIPQIFPKNLPFHGSSKDLLKETKDLGYS